MYRELVIACSMAAFAPNAIAGTPTLTVRVEGVFAIKDDTASNRARIWFPGSRLKDVERLYVEKEGLPRHDTVLQVAAKYLGATQGGDAIVTMYLNSKNIHKPNDLEPATWDLSLTYDPALTAKKPNYTNLDYIPTLYAPSKYLVPAEVTPDLEVDTLREREIGLQARATFDHDESVTAVRQVVEQKLVKSNTAIMVSDRPQVVANEDTPYGNSLTITRAIPSKVALKLVSGKATIVIPLTVVSDKIEVAIRNLPPDELAGGHGHYDGYKHARLAYTLVKNATPEGSTLFFPLGDVIPASEPFCNGPVRFK